MWENLHPDHVHFFPKTHNREKGEVKKSTGQEVTNTNSVNSKVIGNTF
jgi:hypothetical protein